MSRSERRRTSCSKEIQYEGWHGNNDDYGGEKKDDFENQALVSFHRYNEATAHESNELTSISLLAPFVDFFLILILL